MSFTPRIAGRCLRLALRALLAAALLLAGGAAQAGLSTETCLAAKAKAAGTLRKCRTQAYAQEVLGRPADYAKCQTKFEAALGKLDTKAAHAGVACRYRDNDDGTVTDFDTGLQWERKDSSDTTAYFPNPHDFDNLYTWSATGELADGEVFTEFLSRLNGSAPPLFGLDTCASADGASVTGGFAGHCDWRLPTVAELATIVDQSEPSCGLGLDIACIDPVFGPTNEYLYWTSTTDASASTGAWEVSFRDATSTVVYTVSKGLMRSARAVRGGW